MSWLRSVICAIGAVSNYQSCYVGKNVLFIEWNSACAWEQNQREEYTDNAEKRSSESCCGWLVLAFSWLPSVWVVKVALSLHHQASKTKYLMYEYHWGPCLVWSDHSAAVLWTETSMTIFQSIVKAKGAHCNSYSWVLKVSNNLEDFSLFIIPKTHILKLHVSPLGKLVFFSMEHHMYIGSCSLFWPLMT